MTVIELPVKGDAKPPVAAKGSVVAALDIGATKISCLIGEVVSQNRRSADGKEAAALRVLGFGCQASRGTRNGAIVDLDQAERAIRLAVDAAEKMAKRTITSVFVNVAGGRPQSNSYAASIPTETGQVSPGDVEAATRAALAQGHQAGRRTLHTALAQFHLDDARGVMEPVGMFGTTLTAEVNVVSAEPAALRNLALVIERCHLSVADYVVAPYAASRSVLAEDEIKLGVTLIDMGGSTTGIASFHDGHLVFADVIPIGGMHITHDIARGLSTTIAHAERMKTLWGSAMATVLDDRETVAVPLLGERGVDTIYHAPKSMLTGIIKPRLEEILEMVRDRLDKASFAKLAGSRVVLTGGGSELTGAREIAAQWLNRQIRLGAPLPVAGMPEAARSPAFATAYGLLNYALKPDIHHAAAIARQAMKEAEAGYLRRVGKWIADSF
ncbi:cell division protein FtsA [Taklimakanibacter albus]|uniref:Cell division protein FtsA n=1 Tax=Taklimakanibacter albus TaxID=2800327 RepID=A0ACC5QYK5_9HYPH|nr:cell division protein FtsA [Aestuariivirga sp. YIM B02566]MBK1865454.1 cell division protein FtsA [Aestuariivirga sp. YIM B02566]